MLLWRSLTPSLMVAAAKALAGRSSQPLPEAPRVTSPGKASAPAAASTPAKGALR